MNATEVRKLFLIIQNCYSGFVHDDTKVAIWASVLRDVPFEVAQENLRRHILNEKYPPTPAEIAKTEPKTTIPDAHETRKMLRERDEWARKAVPMPETFKARLKQLARGS